MQVNKNNVKRTNPNAMVFIYNYRDRMGDAKLSGGDHTFEVDQIILNTTSLLSVSTNKDKSKPAGSFEIRLAPTKNWVTAITPGSWCIILMSNSAINDKAKYGGGRVDEKSFKMLGRIESVRGVIEVDQATGARKTGYMVQGVDWGTIFDSKLYVDPLNRGGDETALGMAMRMGYNEFIKRGASFNGFKLGPKAEEESPAVKRPKTEKSKKSADKAANFMKKGFVDTYIADISKGIERLFPGTTPFTSVVPAGSFDAVDTTNNSIIVVDDAGVMSEVPVGTDSLLRPGGPAPTGTGTVLRDTNETAEEKKAIADAETKEKNEKAKTGTLTIGKKLPSAGDAVKFILALWGQQDKATSAMKAETNLMGKSQQQFRIPQKAAEYMQFKDGKGRISGVVSQVINPIQGKLKEYDTYTGVDQSAGMIDFRTILGEHSVWQILQNNCNAPINELIPEIRFENGKAKMALYQRVRPFAVKKDKEIIADRKAVGDGNVKAFGPQQKEAQRHQEARNKLASNYFSRFQNVRTKVIDVHDIITCNFGTNWRDKFNFIEVNIDRSIFKESFSNAIKLESQFIDEKSIGRDGLKSMIQSFSYVPVDESNVQSILDTFVYKYALKEWYFNTHKMLNGNIQVIGQDQYIQVGDNIRVKAEALGLAKNISAAQKDSRRFTYLTAHVESISHNAQIDPNGARTFVTSINFTRGIITDKRGNLIALPGERERGTNAGAVDQDAKLVTPSVEKNKGILGTSASNDPDRQKLRGK